MAISITMTESPTNPQRDDPDNFREDADDYVDWHTQTFVPEMNTVIDDLNTTIQNLWVGTSTTSITIGVGSKTFTMAEDNLAFGVGNSVRIAETADPTTNYMSGIITAYNKTTKAITVTVDAVEGSGTISAWTMTLEPPDKYNRITTWSSLTGSVSIPRIVSHDGAYWSLQTNLADVTASEPAFNNSDWFGLGIVNYQEFTSSGSYTVPAGARFVYVECINGGNSGGAIINTGESGLSGGNRGGVFTSKLFRTSDITSPVTVTVGAGGASVTASGSSTTSSGGNTGGTSSFGSYIGISNDIWYSPYFQGWGSIAETVYMDSVKGGAAARSVASSSGTGTYSGGTSEEAGDAGDGVKTSDTDATATDGSAPGGAGGGATVMNITATRTATSGAGGDGIVRVWAW